MKKKKFIVIGAAVVIIVLGWNVVSKAMPKDTTVAVRYSEIYPSELINSISTKGIVESVEKSNVYSTLTMRIKNVNVEVGDVVTEGQVLCELDTEDLVLDIAKQKADLTASQKSSLNQLQNNQRIYNEASSNLQNNTNSQVLNAEASVKTATVNLENAQKAYDDALRDFEERTDSQITTAESNLVNIELDLEIKKRTFEDNKALYEVGAISQEAYVQSEDAYISAQNSLNSALLNIDNAGTSVEKALEQAENNLKTAQVNYDNAMISLDAIRLLANQDLENYRNNIETSKISVDNDSQIITIQKLEKQLEDAVITAPISGTVTAVYAKEGTTGSGLLFVIEDTENLKITTKIKEYDIGNIDVGMDVTIKSDSTGDDVYNGEINKINPTANKNANGETDTTSDIEFGAEIKVTTNDTNLKVGMNTRLSIILEQKDGIYYVPYDSITTDENGESIVYTVIEDAEGNYITQKINVTTGMETDFYVEISSSELKDNIKIITDASAVVDGMSVVLN